MRIVFASLYFTICALFLPFLVAQDSTACPVERIWNSPVRTQALHLEEVTFIGDLRVPAAERAQIAEDLKKLDFDPNGDWSGELEERVRYAWQTLGYFKVSDVKAVSQVTSDHPPRAKSTVYVNEGDQYRIKAITFTKSSIASAEELRRQFPTRDGDIFNRESIGQGLEISASFTVVVVT